MHDYIIAWAQFGGGWGGDMSPPPLFQPGGTYHILSPPPTYPAGVVRITALGCSNWTPHSIHTKTSLQKHLGVSVFLVLEVILLYNVESLVLMLGIKEFRSLLYILKCTT